MEAWGFFFFFLGGVSPPKLGYSPPPKKKYYSVYKQKSPGIPALGFLYGMTLSYGALLYPEKTTAYLCLSFFYIEQGMEHDLSDMLNKCLKTEHPEQTYAFKNSMQYHQEGPSYLGHGKYSTALGTLERSNMDIYINLPVVLWWPQSGPWGPLTPPPPLQGKIRGNR